MLDENDIRSRLTVGDPRKFTSQKLRDDGVIKIFVREAEMPVKIDYSDVDLPDEVINEILNKLSAFDTVVVDAKGEHRLG